MLTLVFLFPKGKPPSFGLSFDSLEQVKDCDNMLWPNVTDGWHAKFELDEFAFFLTVWLPETDAVCKFSIQDWNKGDLKRFLNECKKISRVEFFQAVRQSRHTRTLIAVIWKPHHAWKINVKKIEMMNSLPKKLRVDKN